MKPIDVGGVRELYVAQYNLSRQIKANNPKSAWTMRYGEWMLLSGSIVVERCREIALAGIGQEGYNGLSFVFCAAG